MKKKRWIVVCGAMFALAFLLAVINNFTGNPISASLAKKAAGKYLDETYGDLSLQIGNADYNFKVGEYHIFVQSSVSGDTAFTIAADRGGRIIRDDYQSEVEEHVTTYRRLDQELRETAWEIIGGGLDYDFEYLSFSFGEESHLMELELDMKLDIQKPPFPLIVNVTLFSDEVSYGNIAEVSKSLESVLNEQGVPVRDYCVRILPRSAKSEKGNQAVSWANSISVSYFPAERMDEVPLAQVMEEFEVERVEVQKKQK